MPAWAGTVVLGFSPGRGNHDRTTTAALAKALTAWRGSVLPGLIPRLSFVFGLSLLAVWLQRRGSLLPSSQPFGLLGISLAVFLGFRNKAAYDRYWEGRMLWGQLLNDSRSLMRQALTLPQPACANPDAQAFGALLTAFAHALRHQLRGTDPHDECRTPRTNLLASRTVLPAARATALPMDGATRQTRGGQRQARRSVG